MNTQAPEPQKILKAVHFHHEIAMPEGATIVPYKPQHTTATGKQKKSKKLEEFTYYRSGDDKNKIMKVLYKDDNIYMNMGYYPFTDPLDTIENSSTISANNMHKVLKTEAAYIGHVGDQLVIKKMIEVKLGEDGGEFDTIGDNFESIKIGNNERFQQFLRILKTHPKAMQISIRVVIDESVVNQPRIIDYEFFKRETQVKNTNLKFMQAKAVPQQKSEKKEKQQKKQQSQKPASQTVSTQTKTEQPSTEPQQANKVVEQKKQAVK